MSPTRTTIDVPARSVAAPRGALLVGLVANFAVDAMAAWKARRATRRMQRDAEQLRNLASSVRSSNPSLADDLLAAADRAE